MLNVDKIIETILGIQEKKKLLRTWREEADRAKAAHMPVSGFWEKINTTEEILEDWYKELGEAVFESTRYWNRNELMAVFGLLEE